MAPQAQWIHSFVTDDEIHCLHLAGNAETIHEHARRAADSPQTTSRSSER
jgi:hypothetical protein